ncbi:MarR family winged helix-turn-helix transcriptional regulator [Demequina iriomotensis]|uniref:MarR family winged helix-turn-helix transcriptional regulator n=1 Tax=Demequina iriomotensis TaxID=1536641 RepID=UPI000781375B|nr:MarR family winged helix-turn-helix transcriptional regulator [Demequina iriomotensis]
MSHDAAHLDALARALGRAFDAAFGEALADASTTRVEHAMLSRLAASPEPLTWEALEAGLIPRYGPVACTEAWSSLEVAGWAVEPDGLYLATDAGRAVIADLEAAREAIVARALDGLGEDEVAAATHALRAMIANLGA